MDRVCGHLRARQILAAFSDFKSRAARMILNACFDSRSVDLFNTLDWIDFLFIGRNTPNYINELLVANSSVHMRNTRYYNLNFICFHLDIIMPRRVVFLLHFVLLKIGTLYYDLGEFFG